VAEGRSARLLIRDWLDGEDGALRARPSGSAPRVARQRRRVRVAGSSRAVDGQPDRLGVRGATRHSAHGFTTLVHRGVTSPSRRGESPSLRPLPASACTRPRRHHPDFWAWSMPARRSTSCAQRRTGSAPRACRQREEAAVRRRPRGQGGHAGCSSARPNRPTDPPDERVTRGGGGPEVLSRAVWAAMERDRRGRRATGGNDDDDCIGS
jgi:hypothetical protein